MLRQILRWLILGGTLFFLAKALKDNWAQVTAIHIDAVGWPILAIAIGVTLLAHTWAGWIWTWILGQLNQPVPPTLFIQIYLKTNIAKYIPGNIWHHYGRIVTAKTTGVSASAAALSVLLEPLLMAAAALIIIVFFGSQLAATDSTVIWQITRILALVGVLCVLHPRILNQAIAFLQRLKAKNSDTTTTIKIERYPLRPLLGELGFLGLRGTGFILTIYALGPVNLSQIPLLLGAFSFAWLVGFVVPGAPGGLGVFEATAIALLQYRFPAGLIISAAVLYRLISILAETMGAALVWLDERFTES
jgi:glycosyltransferase 2 family protein